MQYPRLAAALSPQRLRDFHSTRDSAKGLFERGTALAATMAQSPFAKLTPEQIEGWRTAITNHRLLQERSTVNSNQKGKLVLQLGEVSTENGRLKALDTFYAKLLESLTSDFLAKQEASLTEAYCYIYDRQKTVKLTMEEYRGIKQVKIRLVLKVDGKEFEEDTDDEGFSTQTTLGTLLLAHFLIAANYPRIIFFDETLGSHADGPLTKFMSILEQLKKDFGFIFLAVTHDRHRLLPFADRVYFVQDGNYSLFNNPDSVD